MRIWAGGAEISGQCTTARHKDISVSCLEYIHVSGFVFVYLCICVFICVFPPAGAYPGKSTAVRHKSKGAHTPHIFNIFPPWISHMNIFATKPSGIIARPRCQLKDLCIISLLALIQIFCAIWYRSQENLCPHSWETIPLCLGIYV